MKLDRELQIKILEYLADMHPRMAARQDHNTLLALFNGDEPALASNLIYLEEHDFLTSGVTMSGSEPMFSTAKMCIRKDGFDFLIKDGGITAYKNTVTVRFHAEAQAILESCIMHSDLNPQDKQSALAKFRELPFSATEHLMKQLLDAAVHRLPDVFQLIRSLLL